MTSRIFSSRGSALDDVPRPYGARGTGVLSALEGRTHAVVVTLRARPPALICTDMYPSAACMIGPVALRTSGWATSPLSTSSVSYAPSVHVPTRLSWIEFLA